ncbi:MAG: hypothetical protein PVSMB7_23530 [Chloroflexota bacterium]
MAICPGDQHVDAALIRVQLVAVVPVEIVKPKSGANYQQENRQEDRMPLKPFEQRVG